MLMLFNKGMFAVVSAKRWRLAGVQVDGKGVSQSMPVRGHASTQYYALTRAQRQTDNAET